MYLSHCDCGVATISRRGRVSGPAERRDAASTVAWARSSAMIMMRLYQLDVIDELNLKLATRMAREHKHKLNWRLLGYLVPGTTAVELLRGPGTTASAT
jgi:hypothetical protein